MLKKDKKVWKYVVSKKKGLYGETDFEKKVVMINKKYHKSKGNHAQNVKLNKDKSANLLDTIVHEEMHAKHPKMSERAVRKMTPKKIKKMSKKLKVKMYAKYNKSK